MSSLSNDQAAENYLPPKGAMAFQEGDSIVAAKIEEEVESCGQSFVVSDWDFSDDYFDSLPKPRHLFGLEPTHLQYVILDFVSSVFVSLLMIRWLSMGPSYETASPVTAITFAAWFALLVVLGCCAQNGYGILTISTHLEDVAAILQAVAVGGGASLFLTLFFDLRVVSIAQLTLICFATAAAMLLWRQVFRIIARRRTARDQFMRNVVVVGEGRLAVQVASYLSRHQRLGRRVKGLIGKASSGRIPRLGNLDSMPKILRNQFIDEVIVAEPLASESLEALIAQARAERFDLKAIPELFVINWHPEVEQIGVVPVVALHKEPSASISRTMKRIIDVVLSCIALIVASPFMLVVAIIVKLDSPGPVFFYSPRVGLKGATFPCLKFRTMVENAEQLKAHLTHLNERDTILFKVSADPRMTRVGYFLRKYSIDELPQFWNVLFGDMSIVGPRPPLIEEVAQYDSAHLRRLSVRPGITGLWQVNARQHSSFESYILYDFEYIENWSLMLDFRIMIKTVEVVLKGSGS